MCRSDGGTVGQVSSSCVLMLLRSYVLSVRLRRQGLTLERRPDSELACSGDLGRVDYDPRWAREQIARDGELQWTLPIPSTEWP